MDDLNPITRTERLLDGEDLTPTNREEMFIKRIYDKTQEIPEPVNRKEYFLKKAGEAGGDVTVVPLSVTDNGIYSEEGKAYSPVTVAVAPPEDSYQLKSITTPTSLATFNASALPMPSLKVSVEAKQDLHGYDKPWVGGAGKNKFDYSTCENLTIDNSGVTSFNADRLLSDFIPITPNINYTLSFMSGIVVIGFVEYSDVSTFERRLIFDDDTGTLTITPQQPFIKLYFRKQNSSENISPTDVNGAQLEKGSTATSFAPYSNICPISGWSEVNVSDVGKNLLNPLKVKAEFQYNPPVGTQFTLTDIDDMTDNGDGTFSKTISGWYEFGYLFELTESECFFKIQYSGTGARVTYGFLDDSYTVLTSESNSETNQTITKSLIKTGTRKYFFFTATTNQTTADITFTEPQIELGSTATTYEPYINQTTTISLPQTVYGGEVDVVNGGGKSTFGIVDMGSLTWYYSSGQRRFSTPSLADVIKPSSGRSAEGLLCSCFECTIDGTDSFLFQNGTSIYVYASEYTDASTFTAAVTGQTLRYELATPTNITTQPTPIKSLEGTNNLSVDCGEVIEGEYFKALGGE